MILEHDTIDCFLGLFLHKNREMEIQKKRLKDGGRVKKGIIREREMLLAGSREDSSNRSPAVRVYRRKVRERDGIKLSIGVDCEGAWIY